MSPLPRTVTAGASTTRAMSFRRATCSSTSSRMRVRAVRRTRSICGSGSWRLMPDIEHCCAKMCGSAPMAIRGGDAGYFGPLARTMLTTSLASMPYMPKWFNQSCRRSVTNLQDGCFVTFVVVVGRFGPSTPPPWPPRPKPVGVFPSPQTDGEAKGRPPVPRPGAGHLGRTGPPAVRHGAAGDRVRLTGDLTAAARPGPR